MRRRSAGIVAAVILVALVAGGVRLAMAPQAAPEPTGSTFAENPYDWPSAQESWEWSVASFVALAGVVGVPALCVAASLWAQRRRARGEEASAYAAQGGDAGAAVSSIQSSYM